MRAWCGLRDGRGFRMLHLLMITSSSRSSRCAAICLLYTRMRRKQYLVSRACEAAVWEIVRPFTRRTALLWPRRPAPQTPSRAQTHQLFRSENGQQAFSAIKYGSQYSDIAVIAAHRQAVLSDCRAPFHPSCAVCQGVHDVSCSCQPPAAASPDRAGRRNENVR
jgi:hypothetical protein